MNARVVENGGKAASQEAKRWDRERVLYAGHALLGEAELEPASESQGKVGATAGNPVVCCQHGKGRLWKDNKLSNAVCARANRSAEVNGVLQQTLGSW